MSFEVFKVV